MNRLGEKNFTKERKKEKKEERKWKFVTIQFFFSSHKLHKLHISPLLIPSNNPLKVPFSPWPLVVPSTTWLQQCTRARCDTTSDYVRPGNPLQHGWSRNVVLCSSLAAAYLAHASLLLRLCLPSTRSIRGSVWQLPGCIVAWTCKKRRGLEEMRKSPALASWIGSHQSPPVCQ